MSVSAFPLSRRRDVVTEVVRGLRTLHNEEANRFWRDKARSLLQDLIAAGVGAEAAKEEVRALLYTALDEMHRPLQTDMSG